ncbi:PREDICTED: testis-expressed sequence 22 protein [Galeopterus variegatus]|uniref:Testis-expressed sequence 22 protein n=1 Tax=Galeopterus variegatus TaxID=482537 RepID=A0ABM0QVW1_GALVR|nr:PREDICTED: testis-expressed sequence 22 protein [Galeopterus variegatus]
MDSRKLSRLGKKPEPPLSPELRRASPSLGRTAAWAQPSAQSSAQQGLQTQDWGPTATWVSHVEGDIVQIVAQLVSKDVDRDVLLPHPLRSVESTNAFQAFLAQSTLFWQNATLKAWASRSRPS